MEGIDFAQHSTRPFSFIESLFKTLKYCPEYPSAGFATVEHAREWVARFVDWYNWERQHSSIGFVTPGDRHAGDDVAILEARRAVYAEARERWAGEARLWKRPETVTLNPEVRAASTTCN